MLQPSVLVTIALFALAHLIATVWWASRVSTILDTLQKNFAEMNANIAMMKELYVKKEDYIARIAMVDKEREAIWKRIDALREKIRQEDGDDT